MFLKNSLPLHSSLYLFLQHLSSSTCPFTNPFHHSPTRCSATFSVTASKCIAGDLPFSLNADTLMLYAVPGRRDSTENTGSSDERLRCSDPPSAYTSARNNCFMPPSKPLSHCTSMFSAVLFTTAQRSGEDGGPGEGRNSLC